MTKRIKKNIVKICFGAVFFGLGFLATKIFGEWVGLGVYLVAFGIIAYDVVVTAAVNIVHGHVFDEKFLMLLATVGAFACRDYDEAVAVMLFYQIGEVFQSYAVNKSRKSIKALMSIRPDFARIIVNDEEKEVEPSEVNIGDIIIIKPGERVPLDGEIIKGNTSLDTSAITGESLPRDCGEGEKIVSGCVNLSGVISVRVSSNFSESTVSKILNLVEDASSKKAKAEQFITVFARYYTPIIVFSALGLATFGTIFTGDFKTWIYRAMTFLLISCPCALVISIPLSFFGGIGGAGKKGILIKGGNYMDTLSKVDTLVLDKTGTITKGNFAIGSIEPSDFFKAKEGEAAEEKLLRTAAFSERYSTHPIAVSIVNRYGKEIDKSLVSQVTEVAGRGVKALIEGSRVSVGNVKFMEENVDASEFKTIEACENPSLGGTLIHVCLDGHYIGHLHIIDEIKDEAVDALRECRKAGINRIVMLTGDNEKTALSVSKKVGLDEVKANLSPLDKVKALEEILSKKESGTVAFVGDGINDAPVLTRADIGIAMGAMGSDAAIEAADVVIMTDDLHKLYEAKKIARKTLRIVKENIGFALGVKLLVLVLAAFGIAHMWAAIIADVGVAFIAILNAMRPLNSK